MGLGSALVQCLFVAYLVVVGVNVYHLFQPATCHDDTPRRLCVPPALGAGETFDLWVVASTLRDATAVEKHWTGVTSDGTRKNDGEGAGERAEVRVMHRALGLDLGAGYEAVARVPVAHFGTRANGTLHAHVFVYRSTKKSLTGNLTQPKGAPLAVTTTSVTKFLAYREHNYTMLLGNWTAGKVKPNAADGDTALEGGVEDARVEVLPDEAASRSSCDASGDDEGETCAATDDRGAAESAADSAASEREDGEAAYALPEAGQLVTHIRPRITVLLVGNPPTFPHNNLPADIGLSHYLRDDLSITRREYRMLSPDVKREDPEIAFKVKPVNIGLLRLMNQMTQSMTLMISQMGMTESDLDEMKELFTGTDWKWLAMTFAVSILHSWFAFLAFKNDIGFWKKKSNLEGLSVRTQWSSFVCQLIIFCNLADTGQASTIILVEMFIGVAIEGWKVSKFMARNGTFNRLLGVGEKPKELTQMQKDTDEYDKKAMRYLSFALYPIVGAYGIYSLIYDPQRSWRSWVLRTLANGVYMFGFIAMTPQLYINYKLKSVAHLPWKAFMYKAFNTFIDDVFAFAIAMPTIHRLACLRDDLVFFIYLYQRYLYPVDKKRVNEFGRAYEEDEEEEEVGDREAEDDDVMAREAAAVKIQARQRGRAARMAMQKAEAAETDNEGKKDK